MAHPTEMMFPYGKRFLLLLIALLVASGNVSAAHQISEVTRITLANIHDINTNGQAVYKSLSLKRNSENVVQAFDIPNATSFIIIQAHTHERNLTMSYVDMANCNTSQCSLSGSNVGLYIDVCKNQTASILLSNDLNEDLDTLVSVAAYTSNAPIPGGCNLEFDTEIAPYQKLHVTSAIVRVEGEPAASPTRAEKPCGSSDVTLTFYRMYLPEHDFTTKTYFASIKNMTTVDNIIKNAQKIPPATFSPSNRRVFSSYPGTGSIYAMIATYENHSAAYVPIATYACSPLTSPYSCEHLNTTVGQALCAIVLIFGFLITFFGHSCLGLEVFFMGAISGGIISFAFLSAFASYDTSTIIGIVLGVGFLSGAICASMATCTDTCIVTLLSSITLGFFIMSTVYFGITADSALLFESEVNFWLIFAGVTLLVLIVLAVFPFSNVICCAILGAYAIVIPIDYYLKSNLKYILVNTIRRATVSDFNLAIIQPPFQSTDKWLVVTLVICAFFRIYKQADKCCCCRKSRRRTIVFSDEMTPILRDPRNRRRTLVLGENARVVAH